MEAKLANAVHAKINGVSVDFLVPDKNMELQVFPKLLCDDGLEIHPFYYGTQKTVSIADGSKEKSFVHPCDADGNDISRDITRQEWDAFSNSVSIAEQINEDIKGEQPQDLAKDAIVQIILGRVS